MPLTRRWWRLWQLRSLGSRSSSGAPQSRRRSSSSAPGQSPLRSSALAVLRRAGEAVALHDAHPALRWLCGCDDCAGRRRVRVPPPWIPQGALAVWPRAREQLRVEAERVVELGVLRSGQTLQLPVGASGVLRVAVEVLYEDERWSLAGRVS